MADVTFTINDDHLTRFVDGIAGHFGNGMEDDETKAQYGKRKLRRQMVLWVKRYERQAAIDAIVTDEIDVT